MRLHDGLLRAPERNRRSCSARYTALCPARRGQSGVGAVAVRPVARGADGGLGGAIGGFAVGERGTVLGALPPGPACCGQSWARTRERALGNARVVRARVRAVIPSNRVSGSAACLVIRVRFRDARAPNCTLRLSRASPGPEEPMSRFSHARFLISAADPAQFPPDFGTEVAFVGRSNAGKSSAINAITHRHGLARTSKTPGRTRLLNFFSLPRRSGSWTCRVTDTRAGPPRDARTWPPLIDALRTRDSLQGLFVIVDARRGLRPGDQGLLGLGAPAHSASTCSCPRPTSSTASEARGAPCGGRGGALAGAPACSCSRPSGHRGRGGRGHARGWLKAQAPIKNPGGLFRSRRGRLTRHRSHEPGYPLREGSGEC